MAAEDTSFADTVVPDTETSTDPIVKEAQKRFKRCQDWESVARKRFLEDMKFANADADNGYQWPNAIRRNRDIDERPVLTINKTRQHILQIVNDAKKNKPAIKVMGTGNGATSESAEALAAVIRYIEYHSRASVAYDTATLHAVVGGIGYIRVSTDYLDGDSFDQDIFIQAVPDPLTVFMDPDAKEKDKSDSRFCFIFEDIPNDEFEQMYPEMVKDKLGDPSSTAALGNENDWVTKDHTRTCEYFRTVRKEDKLHVLNGNIYRHSKLSDEHKALMETVVDSPGYQFREVVENKIEYFFIVGQEVKEKKEWLGKYIPLVPVLGEETIIEGELDRKGHTRALKDPQRMYNWHSSAAVEYAALQTKTPYIAPVEAIEGYEEYWRDANRTNPAILPYNALADDGREIRQPERIQPPAPMPAALEGMRIAGTEMEMVSGQYQAQMGAPSNERTGKAIQERQRQGDTATYHYIDNLAIAIRQIGKILLDLIPKVYDTKRVIRCQAEDQQDMEVTIDPAQQKAFEKQKNADNIIVLRALNPNIGRYDVMADVGPAYATKREEAFNAMTLILTQAPELTSIVGDLLFQAGDFPFAAQAASRLRRMVPPQALGEGPSQAEQQMQSQIQNLQQLLQKTIEELSHEKIKLAGKAQQKEIDAYKATTERLGKILDASHNEQTLRDATIRLIHDMHVATLDKVVETSESEMSSTSTESLVHPETGESGMASSPAPGPQPPVEGAMQKEGQWFLPDPTRLGRDRPIGNIPKQAPDGEFYSKGPDGRYRHHPKMSKQQRVDKNRLR